MTKKKTQDKPNAQLWMLADGGNSERLAKEELRRWAIELASRLYGGPPADLIKDAEKIVTYVSSLPKQRQRISGSGPKPLQKTSISKRK